METERPLLVFQFAETEIAFGQQQLCADVGGMCDQRLRRRILPADGRFARAENPGFFKTDLFDRIAQKRLMVQIDAGYRRDVAVNAVNAVNAVRGAP